MADTNLVSYLLIEGELTALARKVWSRDREWRVPTLWRSEYLNVLRKSVKAGVLTEDQAVAAWHAGVSLLYASEVDPDGESVLRESIRSGITAYDAHFVVAARDLGVNLVTADRGILGACPDVAISMEELSKRGPTGRRGAF